VRPPSRSALREERGYTGQSPLGREGVLAELRSRRGQSVHRLSVHACRLSQGRERSRNFGVGLCSLTRHVGRITRHAGRMRTRGAGLFACALIAGSLATPTRADAATVTLSQDGVAALAYEAAPGEFNSVTITTFQLSFEQVGGWLVREDGQTSSSMPINVTANGGCTSIDAQTALCAIATPPPDPEPTTIPLTVVAKLHDLVDFANLANACPQGSLAPFNPCLEVTGEGGESPDWLIASDGPGLSRLLGGGGPDALDAGERGSVVLGGRRHDVIRGAGGADDLRGGDGRDEIYGAGGADDLRGGNDADLLVGQGGQDVLRGRSGNDTLRGGSGNDTLRGGGGLDTFYARDGIRDEVHGGAGIDRARVDRGLDVLRAIETFF
jgi:Ca2+-binding RTX toxin-like protein